MLKAYLLQSTAAYQISVVHLSVMKHIWIWFLKILLNFRQLVTQSKQKNKQKQTIKKIASVPRQHEVMTLLDRLKGSIQHKEGLKIDIPDTFTVHKSYHRLK